MIDQNSQFQAILTAIGEAKQANADALGIPWTFAQMGVGDANGTDPFPDRLQTKLINERRRAPLNQLKPDPKNAGIIIAEQVIPENVGGFWIREIGLYDTDGDLVAVANCAPTFKPLLNYFASAWTEIKAGFSGGIVGIINTLANFSPIGLIYQAFAGVLSYLGVDLPSRFTEFGNMIVNGLVNGLLAGLGSVKTAISSIGDASIGWFKEKLGIHSPSRVFAELGGFTMAGLTKGLEGGQKGPLDALSSMGKQLTAAGTLALSATALPALAVDDRPPISSSPAATTYDSHDVYQITLPASPSMDLQSLEKSLRAMLNKIENEKKARQRSKLSDRE